jgi:hypothetical protein
VSMRTALLTSVLTAIFAVSGCSSTQYVEIRPDCTPPPAPVLPAIDRGALWDALGDQQYRAVERYIDGLWAYADEQAAMLGVLCGGTDE